MGVADMGKTRTEIVEYRLLKGRCMNCGGRPYKSGCHSCVYCLREKALAKLNLMDERRERGLCPYCGRRASVPGRSRCRACLNRAVVWNRTSRERRRVTVQLIEGEDR